MENPTTGRAGAAPHGAWLATLALLSALACALPAQAQSVQPNRYGQPASPKVSDDSVYQRQQQAGEEAARQRNESARRSERDRIDQALETNRRAQEDDRARTEHRRATADTPAESLRLRQEHEQRRQASEREREELERQRAAAASRSTPAAKP